MFRRHNVDHIRSVFTKVRQRLDAAQEHHAARSQDHLAKANEHRTAAEAAQADSDKAARVASRIKALVEDDE